MSDQSQGPGWWQASDGKWYPPEQAPGTDPTLAGPPPIGAPPAATGTWGSSTTPPAWGAPPPGYGYGYGAAGPSWGPPPLPSVNGMATASLVCGILGVIPCLFFNGALAVVALVLGIIVVRKINSGEAAPDGRGLAVAGIVLGAIGTALITLWLILAIVGAATDSALGPMAASWS